MLRVLSLGLGLQSVTLARMSLNGDLPPVDAMIFADPGAESASTYKMLAIMQAECEVAGIPLHVVSRGNLYRDLTEGRAGTRFASLPAYTRAEDGKTAILRRQCTNEYKLKPLRKMERAIAGLVPRQRAKGVLLERWIGISLDETQRMKDSRDAYAVNIYPLVDAGMTRHDCRQWLKRNGYDEPEKSACIVCPFHDDAYWRNMKKNAPDEWQQAITADEAIRHGLHNVKCEGYLHRSLVPLRMVNLASAEDNGQKTLWGDAFVNECEGMCGL